MDLTLRWIMQRKKTWKRYKQKLSKLKVKKKKRQIEQAIWDLQNNAMSSNTCIFGVKKKERENGQQ